MSSSLISCLTIRDQLISDGFYLADSSTLGHVRWAVDGRKTILFEEPNDQSADTDLQPAVLSAILILSEQGFFLTSDANWRGPSDITPHLRDAKASCMGMPPRVNPFRDDFTSLLAHARTLQTQTASHDGSLSVGFVRDNCLKFRHVLFEIHKKTMTARLFIALRFSSIANHYDRIATMPLEQWPVDNDVAALELEQMRGSYRAIPVPAYDLQNNLIPPASYRQELQGTLVEIHFTLSHCAFKTKDAFTADIHTLRVLRAPHTVSSIVKRRLPTSFQRPSTSTTTSFVQGKTMSSSKKTRHH